MSSLPRAAGACSVAGGLVLAAVLVPAAALVAFVLLRLRVRRAECAALAWPATRGTAQVAANAIVVLGAAVRADGRPCGELRARLDHAVALWEGGVAPRILLNGGPGEGEAMRRHLTAVGLPGYALEVLPSGANTRAQLGALDRGRRYVVVSSAYHARRISDEARRRGLIVAVSAAGQTPEMRNRRLYHVRLLSEQWALFWYALPPSWTASVRTGPGTLRHVLPDVLAGRLSPLALVWMAPRQRVAVPGDVAAAAEPPSAWPDSAGS